MKIVLDSTEIELTSSGKRYTAALNGKTIPMEIIGMENGQPDLQIDDQHVRAYVSIDGVKHWVTVNGRTFVLTKSSGARRSGAGREHAAELTAPMPGQVRAINIRVGERVAKGQTLLVLEAMKMEMRIQAPKDGLIAELMVKVGQSVEREQILVKMEDKSS